MLRQIFLRPSTNITLIEERQATITIFTRPDNETALAAMCKHLKGVKNVVTLTGKLRKGGAGGTSKGGGIAKSIWQGLQKVRDCSNLGYSILTHLPVYLSCHHDLPGNIARCSRSREDCGLCEGIISVRMSQPGAYCLTDLKQLRHLSPQSNRHHDRKHCTYIFSPFHYYPMLT